MSKIIILSALISLSFCVYGQNSGRADDLNERGLRLYERGDYDAAIADFTKSIELTSRLETKSSLQKGNPFAGGKFQEEAALRERITVIDRRTAIAYANRGMAHFVKSEFDRALSDCDRALAISPGLAEAYVTRGSTWYMKNDLERAIADYSRAIKIDPKMVNAFIGRSMVRLEMGNKKAAFEDIELAIKLDRKNAETYFRRGELYRNLGDADNALADYEYAMKLDREVPGPFIGRGSLRFNKRDFDGAIADFTMALKLDGRMVHACMYRGFALLAQGKDAEAEKDFSRTSIIAPHLRADIDAGIKQFKSSKQ